MTTTKNNKITNLETSIVDADIHLTDKFSNIAPYLDPPYDTLMAPDEDLNLTGGGSVYPNAGFLSPMQTGQVQVHNQSLKSPERIGEAMELLQTDRAVMTPGLNLLLGCVNHDDLASALGVAYNDWLLDTIVGPSSGIYGSIVAAPQKPEKAANEIRKRASEPGIVGVNLAFAGAKPLLGHERYYPIYEACEDTGLPLMLHNASSGSIVEFPAQFDGCSRFLTNHVAIHPSSFLWHLTSMVTHGVPVRFPDMNVVVQEAGLGWIPYWMRRFDEDYQRSRQDAPTLEKPPSKYIREQFYFTSQPIEGQDDPEYLCNIVRMFGGEQSLMFSSDYPHFDFDHSRVLFNTLSAEFDKDELAAIYGGNALEVFDF